MKIHKEWIPYWLAHTHEFRPTTKMPQFRLQDDEIQAISAFIWQIGASPVPRFPSRRRATPRTAKYSSNRAAAWPATRSAKARTWSAETFAANLSRVGEKDNYDYLVRWIHESAHSARAPIARSRSRTWARKITPSTICRSCLTSTIRAARTTATNWSCSSRRSCPACA